MPCMSDIYSGLYFDVEVLHIWRWGRESCTVLVLEKCETARTVEAIIGENLGEWEN